VSIRTVCKSLTFDNKKIILMKSLACIIYSAFAFTIVTWQTDFEAAKNTAKQKDLYILLSFSGSDWCGPCIRLHKEIFERKDFSELAQGKLVLVNADFPRQKKNQLSKQLQQQNDKLADMYNPAGNFPSTVLLNADGKVMKVWDGFPKDGAAAFISDLNLALHGNQ
jgi:thioredoxin-related protein